MKNILLTGSAVTVALMLSACGGSDSNSTDSYKEAEPTVTSPAVTSPTSSLSLTSAERNVKYLISEDNGRALYEFDKDTVLDISNCSADDAADGTTDGQSCIDRWPIYETAVAGDFGLATPHNTQSTYKHHPVYYFFKDMVKGDILGDKVANVWHLIYPNTDFVPEAVGTKLSSDVRAQTYLTSHDARALYTFDKDDVNVSNCYDTCAITWPIFSDTVDTTNLPTGMDATAFGKIERSDGVSQTTYKGQPLYYFINDTKTGETNGDWVKGVWHLLELGSVEVVAPKVLLQSTARDVKYLISDSNNLSLYEFDKDTTPYVSNCSAEDAADGVVDNQSCVDRWPIYAGNSIADGTNVVTPTLGHENQSTFGGHPLYYWFKDLLKGDITGDKVANVWHLVYPNTDFNATNIGAHLSDDVRTQSYLLSDDTRALYTFDKDDVNVSNCYGDCAVTWPIFSDAVDTTNLPAGMDATAFGKIDRTDGTTQTTYKGQPLYYFINDTKMGDTNGDWVKGIWHLLELGSVAKVTVPAGDAAAGQEIFKNCASCHGVGGNEQAFGTSILLSKLGTAAEVETLINYMKNDGTGKNPAMVNIAKGLSEQKIKDVSAYIETLN